MGRGKLPKYPTAAFAAAGAPEKPFQGPDLDTPCRETKVRALRSGDSPGP
jgi:pyruvate dehydrogenase E2 component (dihydrolipoamide acetyltransferase)